MTSAPASVTESIELVRSLYEAFGRGDIDYIVQHVAPDCRWVCPGDGLPYAGSATGPEGVAAFFKKLTESEEVTRFEAREYFTNGDAVVALGFEECRSRRTGKTMSTDWAMIFRVRDDQVIHWESFFDTAAYARAHRA
jgi:ketosteroid isomerase-like protein